MSILSEFIGVITTALGFVAGVIVTVRMYDRAEREDEKDNFHTFT